MLGNKKSKKESNVAEMRMLRWISGQTRQDKIRNECFREKVEIAPRKDSRISPEVVWAYVEKTYKSLVKESR